MNLNEYQKLSRSTALYPDVGKNVTYPALGLCGETGELFEKLLLTPYNVSLIGKELGDCMWYVANLSSEIELNLENFHRLSEAYILPNNLKHEDCLIIHSTRISEIVKKVMRDNDGICDDKNRIKIHDQLVVVLHCLEEIIDEYNFTLADICQMNIDKLFDRKDRGVIKGSGDER